MPSGEASEDTIKPEKTIQGGSETVFYEESPTRSVIPSGHALGGTKGAAAWSIPNDLIVDAAFIGVGAITGAVCRWQIGNIVTRIIEKHPRWLYFLGWHTAGINIVGSFLCGTLAGIPTVDAAASHDQSGITARTRLMAAVGFCGSFTTFSTYSVDVVGMLGKGEMVRAFSYVTANNVGGILAAFSGFNLAKWILGR